MLCVCVRVQNSKGGVLEFAWHVYRVPSRLFAIYSVGFQAQIWQPQLSTEAFVSYQSGQPSALEVLWRAFWNGQGGGQYKFWVIPKYLRIQSARTRGDRSRENDLNHIHNTSLKDFLPEIFS